MISYLFTLIVYQPLYNGLIFLMDVVPWADAGVSVVIFTFLVKLILFPLSQRATQTKLKIKAFEPDLNNLKEKYKDDREGHARAMMAFYKEKGINPFSTFLLTLIQIPIILTLYYIFFQGGLPSIQTDLLYPFVSEPSVAMNFLGLIDISKGSWLLAILVGVSQYYQVKFAMPEMKPRPGNAPPSVKEDFARTLHLQMRYFLPVLVGFISWTIAGAVSLYWITSNLFAIGQELYVRKKFAASSKTA